MLQLHDKNKIKIAGLVNYENLCIESVLSTGYKTLSFSYPKSSKYYEEIVEEGYIRTKKDEFVIKSRDICEDYTKFECILNLETLEANIFDRFESVEQTITASLNLAIVGTGWTVKDNTLKKKRTVRCTNKNALEIVQEIKKTYRVDIVFNTLKREIEVYEHLGEDKGTYFIDSLNLTALQVQSDSYKFATRIIAEGKDNLTFEDINVGKNYVENFQYSKKIKTIYWKDERYTVKESLLEDAKAKLEEISKPFVSYNASILNLAELNPKYKNILDYKLGDTITLISKNNKVKDKQRIVKTVEYPLDHSRDTVELANAILKFEDIQQENQETTDTVNNITTDNGTVDGSTIDSITTKQIEDFEANVIKVAKLKAILAEIENLHVNKADIQNLNAVIARIGTLEVTKASITELNAIHAIIQQIKVGKADITDLNAAVAKVGILENKTAVLENALAGNLTADNFKTNAITAGSAVIAEGAIGSSQISSLSVNKLEAGDITTSKHKIVSADGTIEIVGNQILINRNNVNRVILGEYRKSDGTTEYGLLVRAKDGQTIMLDGNGVHNAGITDGAIDNNKVADNANISGNKLDINSVIREVNSHGTETIAGTRIQVGDRTLDVELSTQKNTITEHGKELSSQKATIQALDNAIKLKVDSQTFTQSTTTINNNINRAKEEAINTANNAIDNLQISSRNLAINSNFNFGWRNWGFNNPNNNATVQIIKDSILGNCVKVTTQTSGQGVYSILKRKPKTTYSWSFMIKSDKPCKITVSHEYGEGTKEISLTTEWTKITGSGIWNGDGGALCFYSNGANPKITYYLTNLIYVEGNKVGDWTPAPDDLQAYAEEVAKAKADLAKTEAIANADGKITEEERKRIKQAQENLNTAIARADKAKEDSQAYSDELGKQLKANVEKYANDVAVAKSELAKEQSKAYADGIVTAEEKKRIDEARKNLDAAISKATEAETKAKSYADSKKQEAIKAAENLALEKSNLAKKYADDVATAKANLAKQQAIANADGKITEEERKRIQQAQENLNTAISKADKAKQDAINEANRVAELKKQEAINSANSHADNKANEALNNAKAYTNTEITTVNSHLNKATAEINVLKKQIELKVGQSDVDKSIEDVKFGGRNLWLNTAFLNGTNHFGSYGCENINVINIENEDYKAVEFVSNNLNGGIYQRNGGNNQKMIPFGKGENLIISGYFKCSSTAKLRVSLEGSSYGKSFTPKASNEWTYFELKAVGDGIVHTFTLYGSNNNKYTIRQIKVEKGTKTTDWTKAPEDTDQLIVDNIKTVTDKISTVESKFTQENNSIKASVQDLNSTTQTITTNVSNINRDLTSKINSNLDAAKSFATDIAIAKANLAKEQAIASADGKITAEEQKRIQQAQANLNAAISKATEAETKAKSYADVKKQEAINSANNNTANTINNLDIGIYNLANESGNFLDNTGFFVANGGTLEIDSKNTFRGYNTLKIRGNSGACYKDYIELQGNTIYCYSCWIKSDRIIPINSSTPLHMWIKENIDDGTVHREIILKYSKEINLNWQQVYVIFKTPSEKQKYLMKPFVYGIGEATVWLANFQVKKGNILNDWTPNPNDLKRYSEEVANAKAELAKQQAIANADGKITEEERKRIQQAQENLNAAIARADKAKQDAINVASTDATNKANNALNSAKTYVNAEITTVNNKVHNVESNLNILSDRINTKVSQSDIDKAVTTIRTERIIYARGTGNDYPANSIVKVNGKTITDGQGRGLRINALNKSTLERVFLQDYDTFSSEDAKVSFVNKINELNNGDFIIIITSQDASYPLHQPIKEALEKIGATLFDNKQGTYREAYALIGKSKLGRGNGVEMFIPRTANDKRFAEVSVKVGEDGSFIGVNSNNMGLEATLIKSNISDVSSSVTQLRDSVTTDIRAINSKTQSIETTLNGKASKQEVTEVNNRVATIKASLDSITQRVSNTESKTNSLETNINGKASKQELTVVNNKVTEVTASLNGITQRVGNTESRINTLDMKIAGAVTLQQFTEFKQSNDKFKFTVEQRSSVSNILPNSSFHGGDRGWLHTGNEFWSGAYSGYGFKGRITGAIKNRTSYNNPERYLQTHKAYKVKKNTTYTINFHYICEKNVQSMDAFVVLSDTEHGDYAQPICILTAQGGSQSNAAEEKPFTYKFNTGNHEWVWIRFDHNGMKSGVNWDECCWVYISEVGIYEGDVGTVKWTPKGGEVYSANYQMDGLGFKGTFEDGTYAYLGKEGLEWYNAGTGHAYHALTYVTSFDIPIGNPGKAYIKLPAEFTKRRSSLKWTVALRGYYYSTDGDFFPFHIHCTGGRDYIENGLVVCEVQGYCKIQNSQNAGDVQFRPLTAMLIAIA